MRRGTAAFLACCVLLLSIGPVRAQGDEGKKGEALLKRLGAAVRRIREFEKGIPEGERFGPGRLAQAKLAARKAQMLLSQRNRLFNWEAMLREAVVGMESAVAALDEPWPGEGRRVGFQERAYISEVDGSAEPYLLYVPTNYDRKRKWPLLVFLHGYMVDLNRLNWISYMYSPTLEKLCEREGAILLMPFGRSNTEFMGIGESDVLRTIGYVRDELNVDGDRILLCGSSMGGSGAYSIACHQPDIFAGVVAVTGRVDYYLWQGVKRDSLPRFKRVQVDTDYALELLPNLVHVSVLEFHGAADREFVLQGRRMKELCDRLGVSFETVEFEDEGHFIWRKSFEHRNFVRAVREARRVAQPRRVEFNTFTLKYSRAYWVSIERLIEWGKKATVRAEVTGNNSIRLATENVASVRLGPGVPGIANPAGARIVYDGRIVRREAEGEGAVRLDFAETDDGDGVLRKTRAMCGPIREAYDGPFAFVYSTSRTDAGDADRKRCVRLAKEWVAYARGVPRLIPDRHLVKRDIERYNLIVVGSPETNLFSERLADRLPIRIEKEWYVLGKHRFPRAKNGLQFIYPNPFNPKRYVLIVDGVAWGPKLQVNHKLDFLPDFIVYTDETVDDGTMFPTNRVLCAGYFDGRWRLAPGSTWLNRPDGGQGAAQRHP